MYLCKIAMDIVAKHIKADKDGVRIRENIFRRNIFQINAVNSGAVFQIENLQWP